MIRTEYRAIVDRVAVKYELDPDLVEAIIVKESSGNKEAYKIELGFYQRYVKPLTFSDTEEYARSFSWGLMQVMGQTARELGFAGKFFTEITSDPELAINIGCKYLKRQINRYPDSVKDAISAYNAGSAARSGSGYKNQDYVDKVLGFYNQIRLERR